MTLGEIKAQVRWELNREGLPDIGDKIDVWVAEELLRWERRALWPPESPGEPHPWSFLETTHTATTVAGTAGYALPTDFQKPLSMWILVSTNPTPINIGLFSHLKRQYAGSANAQPVEYALVRADGQFQLFPTPDDAYSLEMVYLKRLPALDNDQANEFTTNCSAGIIAGVMARATRPLKGAATANDWMAQANYELFTAISEDRSGGMEEDMVLQPSPDVHASRTRPRPIHDDIAEREVDPTE